MAMAMAECNAPSTINGSGSNIALDAITLSSATTAASSWCAIAMPPSGRIRLLRLVRPHHMRRHHHHHHHHSHHSHHLPQRYHGQSDNVLMPPPDIGTPTFGFAVRGGREFGAGFFVSFVERGSEADLKGMRVGDQILRVNGFRVDDAVHKEFVQFVARQERLTLSLRGVSMLPVKETSEDRLTWQIVTAIGNGVGGVSGVGSTPSERSYATTATVMSSTSSSSVSAAESMATNSTTTTTATTGTTTSGGSIISGSTTIERHTPPPPPMPMSSTSSTIMGNASVGVGIGIGNSNGVGGNGINGVNGVNVVPRHCKEMRVRLDVAPRTKLGLGICKGPDWKPGIFVQFTKDGSVARDVGLRQGDQILSVNSIDFGDVLFSEAVAVMKGANQLNMIIRTAAGCDLFPGESSGYNSSASSVTGDQSPCWADPKSKRLTAVHEERENAIHAMVSMGQQQESSISTSTSLSTSTSTSSTSTSTSSSLSLSTPRKEVNKTIIKLSENGTSINNTFIANSSNSWISSNETVMRGFSHMIPPPPPPEATTTTTTATTAATTKRIVADVHRPAVQISSTNLLPRPLGGGGGGSGINNGLQRSVSRLQEDSATHQRNTKSPPPRSAKSISFSGTHATSAVARSSIQQQQQKDICKNNSIGGTSLSSAITEELKKRREKQRSNSAIIGAADGDPKFATATKTTATTSNKTSAHATDAVSNNGPHKLRGEQQQQQQQQQSPQRAIRARAGSHSGSGSSATVNERQHSALMDEFMSFHQRMFKNGFHESEQERQEALNRTAIMEDDVSHRSIAATDPTKASITTKSSTNGMEASTLNDSTDFNPIPPPPPQFANNGATTIVNSTNNPTSNSTSNPINNRQQSSPSRTNGHARPSRSGYQAPISPVPDYAYDNVRLRTNNNATGIANNIANTSRSSSANVNGSRNTSSVTIGQYRAEQQRREPAKFDFIANGERNGSHQQQQQQQQQQKHHHPLAGRKAAPVAKSMENLQSELESTLIRSNLKKKTLNQSQEHLLQHKYDCPLQNYGQYENYQVERDPKRHSSATRLSITANGSSKQQLTANGNSNSGIRLANPTTQNGGAPNPGTGILKNAHGRSSSASASGSGVSGGSYGIYGNGKSSEKSIKFGN